MIDEKKINDRIRILDSDIEKVKNNIADLDKRKTDSISTLNALFGAKQQCESFLKEINNDEPDTNSDSGDVG